MSAPAAPTPDPAQDDAPTTEKLSRLRTFNNHPVTQTIMVILTVVGFGLAFYFYYAAQERPLLTYYVNPVKATIVRAGETTRLSASFDNKLVEGEMTAVQIAIWNQGARSIRKENILKPIVIATENKTPILEATIRKANRDVSQISLNVDEIQQGRVTVQWSILEQNDGVAIQLIYAGNPSVGIFVDGVVEGQPQLGKVEFTGQIKSPTEQYEIERQSFRTWGGFLLVIGLLGLIGVIWWAHEARHERRELFRLQQKSTQSACEDYQQIIEMQTMLINLHGESIAAAEQERVKSEAMPPESIYRQQLIAGSNTLIEHEKKRKEFSEQRVEEFESHIKKLKAKIPVDQQDLSKTLNRIDWFMAIAILILVGTIIWGLYLRYIAQPIGPPFGF